MHGNLKLTLTLHFFTYQFPLVPNVSLPLPSETVRPTGVCAAVVRSAAPWHRECCEKQLCFLWAGGRL